jgi:hypothetical protein
MAVDRHIEIDREDHIHKDHDSGQGSHLARKEYESVCGNTWRRTKNFLAESFAQSGLRSTLPHPELANMESGKERCSTCGKEEV